MALIRNKKRRMEIADANVNITALMDVLVVLLFFLIKSFSVSASQIIPPPGMRLPASEVKIPAAESVLVSLSKKELRVNNKIIARLASGRYRAEDIGDDGRTILPLQTFLMKEIKKRNAIYEGAGDLSFLPPAKILIQADKRLSFKTMKYLLHTASVSGYGDYQFVILNKD